MGGAAFHPKANVESRLIRLVRKESELLLARDEKLLERLTRASFAKRRKTILNSLDSSDLFSDKDAIRSFLERAGVDSKRRGETFSVSEFVDLSNLYCELY